MIAIPAVDLRDGACVQLVGGSYDDERVRIDDPVTAVIRWADHGFQRLHVVDLDAALNRGDNSAIVTTILREWRGPVQVGGGVRTSERVAALVDAGVSGVVVGTRALEDREWLAAESARYPGRLIVAADVRGGQVAVRGWTRVLSGDAIDLVRELGTLPIAGILMTAVDVEGQMSGPDLALIERAVAASAAPIIASGGIGTVNDLRELEARGAYGAVIGMALYTGALDASAIAREFSS
jgi:phosphoribosylformimino-5-aminoimidazole carboxamide ribotide isomerase